MNIILSIVVVEYHSIQEAQECAASLGAHIKVPYEVIVSSNSCYDNSQRKSINFDDEHIRWIFNPRNGGFAYAMNEGLKRARGTYLVIMNSDCIVASDLTEMISFMERHSDIGAIAPQMLDADGNIQDTARPYVSVPRYVWRQIKRVLGHKVSILTNDMNYNKIQTVDWVIGAFIMVSRAAYQQTDGLDNSFFMYAEDLDWCTRIRQAGFEVVYFPDTKIIYKGTRRARSNSKYACIFIKSHMKYWRKFGFFYGYPPRKKLIFQE